MVEKLLKSKFDVIRFDPDPHIYTVDGEQLMPTSTKLKQHCEEFPLLEASAAYAKKRGLSQKEVLKDWESINSKACEIGHEIHQFAETYIRSGRKLKIYRNDPLANKKQQVINFWNKLPSNRFTCIEVEQKMYSSKFKYAGTADFLLYDAQEKGIVIGDYKTNKDIFKTYGNVLKDPFEHLIDNPYNHYQLQLSYYQIMLEDIGVKVTNRLIVWIKEDSFEAYHPDDLTLTIRNILKNVS
jgi:hypothetical protein